MAVILACLSTILALFALGFCWYLYTEVSKRVLSTAVIQLLKQSSEELSKDYSRQFRAIETEWDDMYQKFGRLAGRMDREKRNAAEHQTPENHFIPTLSFNTRNEILTAHRRR